MILYIVLLVMLMCGGFLEVYRKVTTENSIVSVRNKLRIQYYAIPLVIILFLGVFREISVGYDSVSYYNSYWLQSDRYSWSDLLTNFSIDNGFYIILKLIAIFTDDYWTVRTILFLLTIIPYISFIKSESPYPTVSLLIFVGLSMLTLIFGILRQALAGAICVLAYQQIKKKSWVKCLVLILIATTIHKTAIMCALMIFIYFTRIKKVSGFRLIVLSALSYSVFAVAIPIISVLYNNGNYVGNHGSNGGYGRLLFMIVVYAIIICMFRLITEKDDDLGFLFDLSSGALIIQCGALQWALLTRTTVFFSIYWCILIPKLLYKLTQRQRVILFSILAVIFGFMFIYTIDDVNLFVMHQF